MAVVLPVLSFGTADAQCQGAQATNLTLPQGGGVLIDIDGDGTDDFSIKDGDPGVYQASFLAVPLGSAKFLTSGGSGTVRNYAGAINGGAGTAVYGGFHWLNFNSGGNMTGGNWGAPYPKSGHIGIKKAGQLGFIQLTIHSGPTLQNQGSTVPYVISIAEAGLKPNTGGPITAGDCATILPVELTMFKVTHKENIAELNWITEIEKNNAGFEVQRSTNGTEYKTLDFVEGHGSTIEKHEYFFDDKGLRKNQTYYYRLKQIDYNGQFDYSEVVTIKTTDRTLISSEFYPNPVTAMTKLDYNAVEDTELTVIVYNTTGQELVREVRSVLNGSNVLDFNFSTLNAGTYFVKLEAGNDRQYKKLAIK